MGVRGYGSYGRADPKRLSRETGAAILFFDRNLPKTYKFTFEDRLSLKSFFSLPSDYKYLKLSRNTLA